MILTLARRRDQGEGVVVVSTLVLTEDVDLRTGREDPVRSVGGS